MRKTVASFIICALLLTSCNSGKPAGSAGPSSWRDCLGGYCYDNVVTAMVYEQVEGEEEGMYGIQYREVTDLPSLTAQTEIPVCLYFYSSLRTDAYGFTAGIEDLAQELNGRVLIVSVDAATETDIADAYRIEDVPMFILLDKGSRAGTLEAKNADGEYIDVPEVASWLTSLLQ